MLAVFDSAHVALAPPNMDAVLRDVAMVEVSGHPSAEIVAASPNTIFSVPVSTALVTRGLSERALSILVDGFALDTSLLTADRLLSTPLGTSFGGLGSLGMSWIPSAGSAGGGAIDPSTLEAGSSIGVALAVGDISIGSLGTLTYREGDTLIGYGHRFLYNGASNFPMTTVSIIDTMKSLEASYKLGRLGDTIGTVFEDRIAAIGGRIGVPFNGIDVRFNVTDADRGQEQSYTIEMVDEPRLQRELLLSTGFEAIDTTLDRVGQGTVVVSYTIAGAGMPETVERTDTFFSTTDIAVYPPLQVSAIVSALQYNEFVDPKIDAIDVQMEFVEEIRGIHVADLQIDFFGYSPGDTVRFFVSLQTFQGEALTREGEITIPADLLSDQILVRAYGGPRYLESGENAEVFTGIDDLISAIERFPSYETLTIELFANDPLSSREDALFGVDEVTFEFPGYVVYGEREMGALLFFSDDEESGANW